MTSPSVPFTPSDVPLQSLTFLSFARTGLAAAVTGLTDWDRFHAGVDVRVPVLGDEQPRGEAVVRLAVRGPGDVRAVDTAQVIRSYPPDGAVGAEPNYLAHVEFDRPDLPWMFTPYRADPKLPPWLALVVLRQARCAPAGSRPGNVAVVSTFMSELQPLTDSWAWAHVQLLGRTVDEARIRDGLTDAYGLTNLSRLLCPRRLLPQTAYQACVVPAFAIGRLAALGDPLPAPPSGPVVEPLAPAWTRSPGDANTPFTLPVFHSWRFTTGEEGDFEDLAERLVPQVAPWYVGRRLVDTGQAFGEQGAGRLGVVEGPLVSPEAPDPSSPDTTEARAADALVNGWPAALVDRLRGILNHPADAADIPPAVGEPEPVPLVGPPIYADRHTGRRRVVESADANWFGQLNLQARHRIVAGLGTRVVQRDQDLLMQAAWNQLDQLREVNARISQGQLAQVVSNSWYERHLSKLGYGDLLQLTRPTQDELQTETRDRSVRAALNASSTAEAASTAAFRRLDSAGEPGQVLAPNDRPADFRRRYDDRWLTDVPPAPITILTAAASPPTMEEFANSVAQRNLDLVLRALPDDPTPDPAKSAALLRPLSALALFGDSPDIAERNEVGVAARNKIFDVFKNSGPLGLAPTDAAYGKRVRDTLTSEHLKVAVAQENIDVEVPDLAQAVRIFVEPEKVADLLPTVPENFVAEVVREEPTFQAYTLAASEILQELAGPGELVIVTGGRGGQAVEVLVVDESAAAGIDGLVLGQGGDTVGVDVTTATTVPTGTETGIDVTTATTVPTGTETGIDVTTATTVAPGGETVDVTTVAPGGETGGIDLTALGPGEVRIPGGDRQVGDDVVGVVFADEVMSFDLEIEALTELALPQEVLGDLTLEFPSDGAVAQLAGTILDETQMGGLVIEHCPDDDLAGWFTDTGVVDVDVLDAFANGCFEDPKPGPDQRVVDAILAWLARRDLPWDEVNGLCPLELWEFLQNALWVHESIPPIPVSDAFRQKVQNLYADLVNLTWPGTPIREPFLVARETVLDQLKPTTTVPKAVGEQLSETVDWVKPDEFTADGLRQMDVTPVFERPMHEALESYDLDWLLPGLSKIPASDLITVVESNPAFVESFLFGVNHEMAREFLWRNFPANLRGTYFHRFWSHLDELGEMSDLTDADPLGTHVSGQADGLLVLVVRGELVRRYPDLIAVAVRADGVAADPSGELGGRPIFAGGGQLAPVVLQRHREPDVLMVGFRADRRRSRGGCDADARQAVVVPARRASRSSAIRLGPGRPSVVGDLPCAWWLPRRILGTSDRMGPELGKRRGHLAA